MTAKQQGDPAPQLTREDVNRLHDVMVGHEPDWVAVSQNLASALQESILHLPPGRDAAHFQTIVNEFHRDVLAWHNASDAYFKAIHGPVEELLQLDSDDG